MNGKVRFITLGCRVNQYETQGMRENVEKSGLEVISRNRARPEMKVDFVVINTCTVTSEADRESRYWIRRARREHPGAKIVVTGCGVEGNRKAIESYPEVDLVVSNHDKANIADRLFLSCASPEIQAQEDLSPSAPDRHRFTPLSISRSDGKTRAFIKIQDGCNHACSFCKVVLVRGRSRSRPFKEIVEEVIRLRDAGYRDVVFAGIQLGAYGHDLDGSRRIRVVDVLEACSRVEGIERLRLSSIEPTDVEPSLIKALRDLKKCAHHLHVPLQSGDDEILKRMNRRYDASFYHHLIEQLKSEMPDFCLTLDVMAGFPGETEQQFQNPVRLLQEVQPLKCHVFPYSRREGTRAARFVDLDSQVRQERVQRLLRLSDHLGSEVCSSFIGKTQSVLVEQTRETKMDSDSKDVLMQGLTANFMKVRFLGGHELVGQIVDVELVSVQENVILGKRVGVSTQEGFRYAESLSVV